MGKNQERRQYDRLKNKANKLYYCPFEHFSIEVKPAQEGELLDYSGGGVRFYAREYFEKNTQLLLRLEFPGWSGISGQWAKTDKTEDVGVLTVVGTVMWCLQKENDQRYETGVRFTGSVA